MRGSLNFHASQGFILPENLGMGGSLYFQDGQGFLRLYMGREEVVIWAGRGRGLL